MFQRVLTETLRMGWEGVGRAAGTMGEGKGIRPVPLQGAPTSPDLSLKSARLTKVGESSQTYVTRGCVECAV